MSDTLSNSPECADIQKSVLARGITQLVHFTPFQNLLGIIEMGGLIARDRLLQIASQNRDHYQHLLDYIHLNDEVRLDRHAGHINLSIQHPNSVLFRRFRQRCTKCDVWCVLLISPECMSKPGTLFTLGNAASSVVRRTGTGSKATDLEAMFAENIVTGNQYGTRALTRKGLSPCYPTDPQAEVMIPGEIPTSMICGLAFENEANRIRAMAALRVRAPTKHIPESRVILELFTERPICHG